MSSLKCKCTQLLEYILSNRSAQYSVATAPSSFKPRGTLLTVARSAPAQMRLHQTVVQLKRDNPASRFDSLGDIELSASQL